MIITFVGHGQMRITNELTKKLISAIKDNVRAQEQVSFYCGGYGDFDEHCAYVCREIKKELANCELVFVTPYITTSQQKKMKYYIDNRLYDSVLYPPIEKALPRFAITKRNEWMVSCADLVISCVFRTYGGAYKTLQYARRKKKRIIDLSGALSVNT